MNILITGGTGFIGTALCEFLLSKSHSITVLTRKTIKQQQDISTIDCLDNLTSNAQFDVVINLAGEPIADKRWSNSQKQKITQSRIDTTQSVISFFKRASYKPSLFISGSAIGFYGIESSEQIITEHSSGDSSFSSTLCKQWEGAANQAEQLGIRTCLLRTGIVLGNGGGALKKMLLPFKLGLGGQIGSGTQWMPWIHINDMIGLINHCIDNTEIHGPINCTAPNAVTNKRFTQALSKALGRPALLPMPAFMVKILMGEMGVELLLSGKKVYPKKLLDAGYHFQYESVDKALDNIIN